MEGYKELIGKIQDTDAHITETVIGQLITLADFCAYKMNSGNMIEARAIARNFFEQAIFLLKD